MDGFWRAATKDAQIDAGARRIGLERTFHTSLQTALPWSGWAPRAGAKRKRQSVAYDTTPARIVAIETLTSARVFRDAVK
jgi:hypothetical protein